MSDPRWACICESETTTPINGGDFCGAAIDASQSPIDDYYGYVEHVLTLGDPAALTASETLGRVLLLGLVSGVENYFRSILAGLLRVCPISRAEAANQQISYGSIEYYGVEAVEWGLFDAASLAGATEIISRTKKLVGLNIPPGSSLDGALREFDKVCHLRHAAVHSRGALGRGNATALGLGPDSGRMALRLKVATLHQVGAASHSVVRAYNRFLYRETVERWISEGRFDGTWSSDQRTFRPLYNLFHSKKDAGSPANAYQAYRSLASDALATA